MTAKKPFYFGNFVTVAEFETLATEQLQAMVDEKWATICPHPGPRLLSVTKGELVIQKYLDEDKAEQLREHG